MRCNEFAAGLEAFVDGELDAAKTAVMRAHVESCADCRSLHAERLEFRRELRDLLAVELPADLKDHVLAEADDRARGAGAELVRLRPGWRVMVAAAAILLVAWAGWRMLRPAARPSLGRTPRVVILRYGESEDGARALRTGGLELGGGTLNGGFSASPKQGG